MELHRLIESKLLKWKENPHRRPLILEGARQVGKTWAMMDFGKKHYKNLAYFNFENSPELSKEFANSKSPERLIPILQLYNGAPISEEDTLIIFDEVQECNDALNSLKYFAEEAPRYHIMAAGSLLGVAMAHNSSFPVGKVDFIRMHPLSFQEFLLNIDRSIFDYLKATKSTSPLPEIVYNKAIHYYLKYMICGGMPLAVTTMLETNDVNRVDEVLNDIAHSYQLDFSKHASKNDISRINDVWMSIPSQLAKENRKFVYKVVKPGARAREYENALLWLQQAGLIHKIYCCTKPALPISAYDDVAAFKVYLFDIGILRVISKLPATAIVTDSPLYTEFKGAFLENAILQSLITQFDATPGYWVSTSGRAEVDFLIQDDIEIIPIEVKASVNTSSKSLAEYIKKYRPDTAVIASRKNMGESASASTKVIDIPHFALDWLPNYLK